MGSSYFRAYPSIQAFALPPYKDKQRSQPTPSDYIWLMPYIYIIYRYSISMDIMHPRRRSVALPLCTVSSLLSLNTQNSNVRKRLSRSRPYNWFSRLRFLLMSFDLPCSFVPCPKGQYWQWTGLVCCKCTIIFFHLNARKNRNLHSCMKKKGRRLVLLRQKISTSTYTSSRASFTPRVEENLYLVQNSIYTSSQEQLTPRAGFHIHEMMNLIDTSYDGSLILHTVSNGYEVVWPTGHLVLFGKA